MTALDSALAAALRDRYVLERELGRGGMAIVYLARDLRHDRPVALKVLHHELAHALGPERFEREIKLAARLQHPHILTVLDSGEVSTHEAAGGRLWFTMPFVEGESLRERLRREKQLPVDIALRIATQAARALDYAHRHDVVHRDIKPENILLTRDGETLVADFGIARALSDADERLTDTGMVVGTPSYMSPEQAAGERSLGPRSDIYSLGCVLYEMLAGEPPYTGPSPQAILAKRLSHPVPQLRLVREVPPPIERAVTRALSRVAADRFATAAEFAAALETAHPDSSPTTLSMPRATTGRRALLAGGLVVAALGSYAAFRLVSQRREAPPASTAVLPFVDVSPRKDQEYFSDGLTDELITSLSHIKGIRVAGRTSSFQFKGRSTDLSEVGRRLDVGAVLEGSVRKTETRVRINAQLVSVKDGYQLWSEAYDRELGDVFAVQEDIARAIVSALRVRLGAGSDSALAAQPTRDLEAYDLYLKGRFAWNQRTAAGLSEAVRYLEQAVARDPGFARAHAALADAYILVVPYAGASREEAWPKAQAEANRALALDSTLAEAHTSLGYGLEIYDWDWPAAEASFRRSIAADPTYATGHHWFADFLVARGRLEEGLREMQRAHELDPLSRVIGVELGWVYYLMHRNDEAVEGIQRTLALDQNYPHGLYLLGLVYVQQRRYPEAIALMKRAEELGGFQEDLAGGLAYAYAVSGDRAGAMRQVSELRGRLARGEIGPFALALAYTGLGDRTRAIEFLHRAIDQRDIFMPEDFFDPLLDPLRRDPRFARVVERMGLQPRGKGPN